MDSSAINLQSPGRRRGSYGNSFKADMVAACKAPGVSAATIALTNSLNANLVRSRGPRVIRLTRGWHRWIVFNQWPRFQYRQPSYDLDR